MRPRGQRGGTSPLTDEVPSAGPGTYLAHESSYIDQPCEIGPGTRIWHFSHVRAGARIGANCVIGQNVYIAGTCVLGDNVKVQNNVSIYDGVELEDDVFCGPSVVFTNVVNPRSAIPRKDQFRRTRVGRGATLGANATIICGRTIGAYAFVAAGAVVTRDVPDYALVMGVPARQVGWMCACGESLRVVEGAVQCTACGTAYKLTGARLVREGR